MRDLIPHQLLSRLGFLLLGLATSGATLADPGHYLTTPYGVPGQATASIGQHKATVKRIVNVPDDLPFEQKVQLGEQVRANEHGTAEQGQTTVRTQTATTANTKYECGALDKRIKYLDALARQPQSGQRQDQIRAERSSARERQFQLKCG